MQSIKRMISQQKPRILVLTEPKVPIDRANYLREFKLMQLKFTEITKFGYFFIHAMESNLS